MDSDLTPSNSAYFQILKKRRADLDFIMPQFYNGVTRAHVDGLEGSGVGALSAASMFDSLSNDMFDSEPSKVVFGFCISDCAGTGSNVNGNQAVEIMSDLKTINDGEFTCNGGAFFWVALHDQGGVWSDAVVDEVSKSAGCSTGATTSSTTTITPEPETSTSTPTAAPETSTTSTTSGGTLLVDRQHRCGVSEAEARGNCAKVCSDQGDCGSGEWCWQVFDNYCGSLPDKIFVGTPVLDATPRCGTSELDARGLCKNTCVSDADCDTSLRGEVSQSASLTQVFLQRPLASSSLVPQRGVASSTGVPTNTLSGREPQKLSKTCQHHSPDPQSPWSLQTLAQLPRASASLTPHLCCLSTKRVPPEVVEVVVVSGAAVGVEVLVSGSGVIVVVDEVVAPVP